MSNKKLIKNLLTTASALAVLATGTSAFAAEKTTGGNETLAGNGTWSGGAFPADNDTIKYDADARTINFDRAAAIIGSIDVNNVAPGAITINESATVGNITSLTGAPLAGAKAVNIEFNAIKTLTLSGTTYNQLGTVDFNNKAAAKLVITGDTATLDTVKFRSQGGANGTTVQISGNDVTFKAVTLHADLIGGFVIDTAKKLTLDTGTDLLANNANAALLVNGTGALVLKSDAKLHDATIVGAGGKIDVNGTASARDVTITDAGTLTVTSTNANPVRDITITAAGTVDATLDNAGTIRTITANAAGSIIKLSGGTVTTITAAANGNGVITINDDVKVGRLGTAAAAVASVNFAADKTLTLGAGGNQGVTAITTATDNTGAIILGNQDLTVKTVGADGKFLKSFTFGNAAKTLAVTGDKFNVTTVDGLQAIGAADTVIDFQETVDVSKTIFGSSDGKVIGDIKITGAKTVTFGDSLKNVRNIKFDNAASKATISSLGNKGMNIVANHAGDGELTFNNAADLEVAKLGTGGGNALGKVTLDAAGDVKVTDGANTSKIVALVFTANAADAILTVDQLDGVGVGGSITTASAKSGGTLAFTGTTGNSQLVVNLGTDANSFTAIAYTGTVAKTLDLNHKQTFGAIVTAAKADTLTVTNVGLAGTDTIYGGFGTKAERLLSLEFDGAANTATVKGGTFAKTITTTAATKVTFEGTVDGVDSKDATFALANGTITTFADKADLLNIKTDAANAGNGALVFKGSHKVGLIGGTTTVASMDFQGAAGTTITLTDSIAAVAGGAVKFVASTVSLEKALTIGGKVAATGTTFNIGTSNLTLTETPALDKVSIATKYKAADNTMGLVSVGAANNATVTNDLTFNVSGDIALPGTEVANVFTALNAKTLLTNDDLALGAQAGLIKWSFAEGTDDTNVKLVASDNSKVFIAANNITNTIQQSLLTAMISETTTGAAKALLSYWNDLASTNQADKVSESLNRLTASAAPSVATASAAAAISSGITSRMASTTSHHAGMASGDESMGFGVWAQGFGSRSTQKARKGDAGYKGNVMGGTVGADTMISDASTLGIAVSYAASELKFKDAKAGDKTKSNNMFFSVYGKHEMANNWFVQGNAAFGSGTVKANMKTAMLTAASAKYDTMAFSIEALAGYSFKVADAAMLVPAVGLSYMNVNEGGFTETGTAGRTITKKSADKITAIAGAALQGGFDMSGSMVTPEVHAYVNYDLKAKNPQVEAKIDGFSKAIDVTASKAAKVSYNLGTSLTARTGMVEYGVGYDAKLANKFVSHQGTLRLRVEL